MTSDLTVGWIGLGKLGLPCALTMAHHGHDVVGTDVNPDIKGYLEKRAIPYEEDGVPAMLASGTTVRWKDTIKEVVDEANLIFVAVQTPHNQECEGVTPYNGTPHDFFYGYLEAAVKEAVRHIQRPTTLVIVSTVLPGTTRRLLLPHAIKNRDVHLVYSPAFIAMGTTMHDWSNPEFVLMGGGDIVAQAMLTTAHRKMHRAPMLEMSIESAELTKMTYNAAIGMKIALANTIMEMSDKLGANCDDVTNALARAKDRIVSSRYMQGGMGDGGGCHPRDQIALAYLADSIELSANPFTWLIQTRESQTKWLMEYAKKYRTITSLPVIICGKEYKKNTKLDIGSPSRLLKNLFPPAMNGYVSWAPECDHHLHRAIYVIGCNHDKYASWKFPKGSIVLDPWAIVPDQDGVHVNRIGRR